MRPDTAIDFQNVVRDLLGSTDFLGYVACGLVLLTFSLQAMLPLRLVALCSNMAFIAYGWATRLMPILILHCLLAFINTLSIFRALSARNVNKRSQASARSRARVPLGRKGAAPQKPAQEINGVTECEPTRTLCPICGHKADKASQDLRSLRLRLRQVPVMVQLDSVQPRPTASSHQ